MHRKWKFKDLWLTKDFYKDWLVKNPRDIHMARLQSLEQVN